MIQRVLYVGVLWALLTGQGRAQEAMRKELAQLEGTWAVVTMEVNGKSLLEKGKPEPKLVIKDGKATSEAKQAPRGGADLAKALDPSRKPKTVTLPLEGPSSSTASTRSTATSSASAATAWTPPWRRTRRGAAPGSLIAPRACSSSSSARRRSSPSAPPAGTTPGGTASLPGADRKASDS